MNEKEIYEQNELKANKSLTFASVFIAVVLLIMFVLTLCGVNAFSFTDHTKKYIEIAFPIDAAFLLTPVCFLKTDYFKKPGFKYFLLILFICAVALVNFILPKDGILLWGACIAVAALYFNPKVTKFAFILTGAMMVVVTPLSMFYGSWDSNMLSVSETQFATLRSLKDGHAFDPNSIADKWEWVNHYKEIWTNCLEGEPEMNRWASCFVFYFLPRFLTLVILFQLANGLSVRTSFVLSEQIKETKHNQKMTSELSIATAIQVGILPSEFPDSKFGEIYAIMDPAKEVGGDFYDFFPIGENNTALVIGDASGKGVPASLFMMKAQSLIRALARTGKLSTAEILSQVNEAILEGNELTMFVTCWLGIINKDTGELRYTNAGHNPAVIKTEGKYQYLNAKPGLVLGGYSGFKYEESVFNMKKGDKILLYTDGVTEAHNVKSELYSEERLLKFVSELDASPYETITKVREDVREFSRNTEQFDDITMLMLEYRKPQMVFSKKFRAEASELENVQNFILNSIKTDLTPKHKNELLIVIEEIFINIASYSYTGLGFADIEVNLDNNVLTLVFKDNGVEFNPLAKDDPNIKLAASDRQIGGLGIFMVKNLMDKVYYEYKDEKNILTLVKKY